jgi:hypothetical protein
MPSMKHRVIGATLLTLIQPLASNAQSPTASALLVVRGQVECPGAGAEEPPDPSITSSVPSTGFRVGTHFRESIAGDARVRIAWLGATFRRRFLERVESGPAGSVFRAFITRRSVRGDQILAALGRQPETTLGALWCLLRLQPRGEAGVLLTAVPNLLFAQDAAGKLWTVDVVWGGAGWEIGASAVDADRQWPAGALVISR